MLPSSGLPLQVKNPKEQGNRCPDPQETTRKFECPDKGNRIGMKLGGIQVQMIEHSHLEFIERKPDPEVFEHDLLHGEGILSKLRANTSIRRHPRGFEISSKPLLATAILDNRIGLPTGVTIDRGYPSGFRTDPI